MDPTGRASRRALLAALAAGAGCLGAPADQGGSQQDRRRTPPSLPTPVVGDPDADVTVMAFEDYACPHCRRYALEEFPEIATEYVEPGVVRYEHHDFPIPVDERWSWWAAGAARAVQDEAGNEAFFRYSRLLYENQGDYSLDLVGRLAEKVGVDADAARTAAREGTYRPVLDDDRQRGLELGVEGTPTVLVDGEPTDGYDHETVAAAIEAARE